MPPNALIDNQPYFPLLLAKTRPGEAKMDIVDCQIHLGPGGVEATLAAMDALGISAVLIDEYWKTERPGDAGYRLKDGIFRVLQPTAELAALLHPTRFSYLVRPDPNDPELPALIRLARDAPGALALRITPGLRPEEAANFAAGGYDAICAAACEAGLPLFMFIPGLARHAVQYAKKFPALRIIIDHCGLLSRSMQRAIGGVALHSHAERLAAFEEVLALAAYPNVALKWAHAPAMFELQGYPGTELWPILRNALNRFGANRVMWASDFSMNQTGESWGELLFSLHGNPDLSPEERAWLLGGTARAWLNWPA